VTHLRQKMLDELQRRSYSPNTVRSYIHAVEEFARYFRHSPDQLGPDHVREYQVHLFRDRKLSPRTIEGQAAALRFLFVKTLRRSYLPDAIPFPKCHKRLATVLRQDEVDDRNTIRQKPYRKHLDPHAGLAVPNAHPGTILELAL
jgi:integrase/recombinase XerD